MQGCLEGCAGVWKRRVTWRESADVKEIGLAAGAVKPTNPARTRPPINHNSLLSREKCKILFTIERQHALFADVELAN